MAPKKKDLSYFQAVTREMVEHDSSLREQQKKYEAASQLRHTLPEPLDQLEWVIPYKSAVPFVALKGGTQALSGLRIRPSIHPITTRKVKGSDATADQIANYWETVLEWELGRAMRRVPNFQPSVMWNSLVYDEICGMLIHLPTQIRSLNTFGGDTARHKAAMVYGNHAVRVVSPQTVHSRWSDYMLEAVAHVNIMPAQKIVDFWGEKNAKAIAKRIRDDEEHAFQNYLIVDFFDLHNRCVWAVEGDDEDFIKQGAGEEIVPPTPNAFPFIPWSISIGGTNTEEAPAHRRKPLLYGMVQAEQWLITNIVGTLGLSQAVSEVNAPLHEIHGTGGQNVLIDHRTPGGVIYTQQHQIYERLQRGDIDPGIQTMLAKYESDMNASTLPRVLVTSEAMPGESYSGYNLRVQTAIGALMPFKRTGERWYDDIMTKMLLYCHYTGEDIMAYTEEEDGNYQEYRIHSEYIDPKSIELHNELTPDVPIDRGQRINNAVAMAERLNYSPIKILEFMGETDPHGALQEWIQWQFVNARVQGRIQRIAMEESGEIERLIQMGVQQQLMMMMGGGGGGGGGMGMPPGPPPTGETPPPFGGETGGVTGNNPAMMGEAPIVGMGEEATFEGATGETRGFGGGVA